MEEKKQTKAVKPKKVIKETSDHYTLPAVALRGLTVMPGMIIHFDLSRPRSIQAIEKAMSENERVFLVAQKDPNVDDPDVNDVFEIGTLSLIRQVTKLPGDIIRVLAEGERRLALHDFMEKEPYIVASVSEVPVDVIDEVGEQAMLREMLSSFEAYGKFYPKVAKSVMPRIQDMTDICAMIDEITANLPITFLRKQEVLSAVAIPDRFIKLGEILLGEAEIASARAKLSMDIKSRIDKNQKDYLLREQLHYIREELGEENTLSDAEQFEEDLKKLKAPADVKDKIKKEIVRFRHIAGSSSEAAVERGYIETLLELPWSKQSKDSTDISRAEEILNEDHYGLDKVKERILEYLAVRALTNGGDAPILCLVGPPGTGKTSIARSVAKALNKKYVRICLGGVRDEAEIRGHRRTYVGAMAGRIAQSLRQAGVNNPLMLLDEIDKVGSDQRGDTASALLEVLDNEQNVHFRDHYVEIPLDLSGVLFLATANSMQTIPRPLLDRMEIIEVTSYTANEKFHIAKEHLLAKQLKKNGLDESRLSIADSALKALIESYTREAGVRDLERKIGQICRKVARKLLEEKEAQTGAGKAAGKSASAKKTAVKTRKVRVTAANLETYLGKVKYTPDKANEKDEVGVVRGLAWTSVGGDTLEIEVNIMPGKGELELTGQMGDVMKESAMAGISFIRSIAKEYKISADTFKKNDFHIHIPEGAVPKDGPSAGITMATAVFSALTNKKVKASVAMTGEITLRGRVLPIGGLKEKILAAKTAGIKTVLVPKENTKDVEEISAEIKSGVRIVYVSDMKEVLKEALV